MKALRYNTDKPDYTFITRSIMDALARVMTYGAKKYARDNWKLSLGTEHHEQFQSDIIKSLLRHAHAINDGELIDEESGLRHMDMVASNAMMWSTYQDHKEQANDV